MSEAEPPSQEMSFPPDMEQTLLNVLEPECCLLYFDLHMNPDQQTYINYHPTLKDRTVNVHQGSTPDGTQTILLFRHYQGALGTSPLYEQDVQWAGAVFDKTAYPDPATDNSAVRMIQLAHALHWTQVQDFLLNVAAGCCEPYLVDPTQLPPPPENTGSEEDVYPDDDYQTFGYGYL